MSEIDIKRLNLCLTRGQGAREPAGKGELGPRLAVLEDADNVLVVVEAEPDWFRRLGAKLAAAEIGIGLKQHLIDDDGIGIVLVEAEEAVATKIYVDVPVGDDQPNVGGRSALIIDVGGVVDHRGELHERNNVGVAKGCDMRLQETTKQRRQSQNRPKDMPQVVTW
jgi:hypothetical protein